MFLSNESSCNDRRTAFKLFFNPGLFKKAILRNNDFRENSEISSVYYFVEIKTLKIERLPAIHVYNRIVFKVFKLGLNVPDE